MIMKLIGVILVIAACGSVGFKIAANYRQEERSLRQLISILDYMEWELHYRLTALPELCRQASRVFDGLPAVAFLKLAQEMESQIAPNMECCMSAVLEKLSNIPPITKNKMELLGKSIGRFDLEGQLKGLKAVRQDCRRELDALSTNRESRLRSYQTLGLCAGAALAILLV